MYFLWKGVSHVNLLPLVSNPNHILDRAGLHMSCRNGMRTTIHKNLRPLPYLGMEDESLLTEKDIYTTAMYEAIQRTAYHAHSPAG